MKEPIYRSALHHSWHLLKTEKFLWPLGLFAALLGHMGIAELLSNVSVAAARLSTHPILASVVQTYDAFHRPARVFAADPASWMWFFWVVLAVVALIAIIIFVAVVSQGALIHATAKSMGIRRKVPDLGHAWHAGVTHFWRLFSINLFRKLVIAISVCIVGYAAYNAIVAATVGDAVLFLFVFVLTSIVGMVVSFLSMYAAGYVVVEEYRLGKAIHEAWNLFVGHWLVSIEVALIVLVGYLVLFILGLFGIFVFFFPTIILWFIATVLDNAVLLYVGTAIGISLFTIFAVILGSLFTVFTTSLWTYVFVTMHKKGIVSRILHPFHRS